MGHHHLRLGSPLIIEAFNPNMRHNTINAHHVGSYKVVGMSWMVVTSEYAKAPYLVSRDYHAQANQAAERSN
jgi:hypothetical protein